MPQIAIIADDLTGAADAGACFAQAGVLTLLALAAAELPESDVLVMSTESRHLEEDRAVDMARLAALRMKGDADRVYKKIDSTLRGHPGPELAAVMDALGLERVLVAPAFPAQGRTTVDGRQLVDGRPLEHSPFNHQVHSSGLLTLFGEGASGWPVRLVELSVVRRGPAAVCEAFAVPGPGLMVADAETEVDLMTLAQAALTCGLRLLCGSAGLARALAEIWPGAPPAIRSSLGKDNLGSEALPPHLPGPALVVAGSRHRRTARQIGVAQSQGAIVLGLELGALGDDHGIERSITRAAEHLAHGRDLILTTIGLADSPLGGQAIATWLADVTRRLVIDRRVGRLVLTGGDVAAATCAALEASTLWLRGETQPGIAWGVLLGGLQPGLLVVTKAGGFGTDDALAAAITRQLVL